jgi:hypothetical protein
MQGPARRPLHPASRGAPQSRHRARRAGTPLALFPPSKEATMADLAYVLATLGFFGLAWGYALACERL